MRWITSANVACGGHAGDAESMQHCVALARKHKVRLGAHPGPWDRPQSGRGEVQITGEELELLLLQQVSALQRIASNRGVELRHIKLHGALYHATERDPCLAEKYLAIVQRWWPKAIVCALAGGTVARLACGRVQIWEEAFLDRNYRDDGSLVPRADANALILRSRDLAARLEQLSRGTILTVAGKVLAARPRTLCIHADTPGALRFARMARSILIEPVQRVVRR